MQRIEYVTFDQNNATKIQLYNQYHTFLQLLSTHVSARSLSVLATPQFMSDVNQLGWYTDLEGQPMLLKSITDESIKQNAEVTLKKRLNDIDSAIKQLLTLSTMTLEYKNLFTEWFRRVSSDLNTIYVINNDPVITYDFEQPALVPVITTVPKIFPRWVRYLLLLLMLLGLLGLLWYFFCPLSYRHKPLDVIPPIEINVIPEPKIKSESIPDPVPDLNQIIEPEAPSFPDSDPDPVVELQPVVKPAIKNDPNCVKKETIIQNNNPSKMVLIFDNSGSMNLTLMEPISEINRYINTFFTSDEYDKRMTRLPSRLSESKKVAASSIDKIQANVDIGLVVLNKCSTADKIGFYNNKNRNLLKNRINQLVPLQNNSATPLYSGIQVASDMLNGVNRDDYILIISDGEDNCSNNNICTLVFSIAQKQPRLKINIIDIAGLHKIDCVANLTGGKVFIAQNQQELVKQMSKVVKQMDISRPICN